MLDGEYYLKDLNNNTSLYNLLITSNQMKGPENNLDDLEKDNKPCTQSEG